MNKNIALFFSVSLILISFLLSIVTISEDLGLIFIYLHLHSFILIVYNQIAFLYFSFISLILANCDSLYLSLPRSIKAFILITISLNTLTIEFILPSFLEIQNAFLGEYILSHASANFLLYKSLMFNVASPYRKLYLLRITDYIFTNIYGFGMEHFEIIIVSNYTPIGLIP